MTLRSYQKSPQRSLFDAAVQPHAARWYAGATLDYLGNPLCLKLDTDRRQAMREDDVLHLPLPPDATERQIQDAAESWLRREAEVLFSRLIDNEISSKSERLACGKPTLTLSFSLRGSWTKIDNHVLRLNWRLIEQPLSVIELTLRRAVAMLPLQQATAELF